MIHLVYFSSASESTHRFTTKLGLPADRVPLHTHQDSLKVKEAYVLVTPTYGGGNGRGAVPKQVIKCLNDPENRSHIRGVISAGNTNFGEAFCLAGDIVARKCQVAHLYRFELMGTADDVERVREGLKSL